MLIRKAVRSILVNKRSYMACIWLVAVGVLFLTIMSNVSSGLRISRDAYFKDNKLADVFSTVAAIPKAEEGRLLGIEGIKEVSFQNVVDARVVLDDRDKVVILRINSIDEGIPNPINAVTRTGSGFYADNDIIISEPFLSANNLSVGDSIDIILEGKQITFRICGTGESPQYVYTSKSAKEMLPDPSVFGVAYLQEKAMNNYLGKQEVYNTANFILWDGYSFDDVKMLLEDELSKFGLIQILEQKYLPSVVMLDSRVDGITTLSSTIPYAFIAMAVIVLYMTLKRVIELDRAQIGTLKALGYSNLIILAHYMFFGLVTGTIGSLAGIILGTFL